MDRSEAIRQEIQGQLTYLRLMTRGALAVGRLLVLSAGEVKRFRQTASSEQHYTRPPRRYDLPSPNVGAAPPRTWRRYLHPTRLCDSQAPEVVALAHQLGAGQKSDLEYAQAAFSFAKEELTLEIAPIDGVVETLRRGTGTCFQLITVFIALCRAAGIPARYKIFATDMIQAWRDATIDVDPLVKKWVESLGYFPMEGEGEAFVDGRWMVAHVGPTAERQAAAGIPITRFGEDSLGVWFFAQPGTIMRLESLPLGLAAGSRLLHKIAPGSMERVNVSVQTQIARGQQILDEAGGARAYDAAVRQAAEAEMS